jgi:hypothetical protein
MIGCEVRDQLIEKVADHFEVVAMTLWHRGTYGCVMKPLPNRRDGIVNCGSPHCTR